MKYFQFSHAARAFEGCDQTYRPKFADPRPSLEDRRTHGPAETDRNVTRPLNPKGQDGERLLCLACGSYRHMIQECQHSWENMKGKAKVVSSNTSLLRSKPSRMKAGVVVHMPEDRARIPGSWTDLVNLSEGEEEKKAVLVKPHRQMGLSLIHI